MLIIGLSHGPAVLIPGQTQWTEGNAQATPRHREEFPHGSALNRPELKTSQLNTPGYIHTMGYYTAEKTSQLPGNTSLKTTESTVISIRMAGPWETGPLSDRKTRFLGISNVLLFLWVLITLMYSFYLFNKLYTYLEYVHFQKRTPLKMLQT